MKQESDVNVIMDFPIKSPDRQNEFNDVSDVANAATVAVKAEPELSYFGNSTCQTFQIIHSNIHTTMDSVIESADLHDEFNVSDFGITSTVADTAEPASSYLDEDNSMRHLVRSSYKAPLKRRFFKNPTFKAGTKKLHEKCDMNAENNDVDETENLPCDLFLNSVDQGVCNGIKTIKLRNRSVLKRLGNTPQGQTLEQHKLIHSDIKPYQCSECTKKFKTRKNLKSHKITHSDIKPYECTECEKTFKHKISLESHKLIHSGKMPYECTECEKTFRRNISLESHKLIHSGKMPYKCTECEKTFMQKRSLEGHKLIHSGKMPYECTECGKKFIWKNSFECHKLIHSGVKPYECTECKKKFRQKVHLESHKLIHSGKKPYECSECEKKFRHKISLENHKLIHSVKKPSECKRM